MPIVSLITFSEESSCQAKADNKEVLPEPGGPNSKAILQRKGNSICRKFNMPCPSCCAGPSSSRRPWLMRRHGGILSMAAHMLSLPSPSLLRFPLLVISSISMSA